MVKDRFGNNWYKGNLHTHTTCSDGRSTPEDTLTLYKEHGYDFIALTDHYRWRGEAEEGGILCLSGCEYDTGSDALQGIYHITAIGCTQEPRLSREPEKPTAAQIITEIRRCGGLAVLAHPAWSMNTPEGILSLPLPDALEIYNTVSGRPWNCRPESGAIVDQLALRGCFPRCIATDDTHFYNGDACRSYIMVKAEACTREALLAAILAGDYYATQGPDFSVSTEGDELVVRCSPVQEVVFYTNMVWTGDRVARGDGLTEARYRIKPGDTFVRVELTDARGNSAWSPAFPVNVK